MKPLIALAAALALTLAACAASAPTPPTPSPSPSPATQAPPSRPPDLATAASGDGPFEFGETATWQNGAQVTLTAPVPFTPSDYVDAGPTNVRLDVTITNPTAEDLDAAFISVTATSGGTEAADVFDAEAGLQGTPSAVIPAGQSLTFPMGWTLAETDLTVTVSYVDQSGSEHTAVFR